MFNFKTKLLATIFICSCLLFASPASAEYFSDVILTGTEGIWVDSRSYISLQAAVTAVGASDREIVIIGAQAATALTVPANARLKFLRDGSINNTGQLTINTRNISAEDRQIFTGTGDIDFIDGSVVRSSWFSDVVEAFDVTLDDSLTMVISETGYITLNTTVGNDVTLKWESPDNLLIVYGSRTLSNVKNIIAGSYQIFAGAGDIDFLDGTVLYLNWFRRLRSALTWIESEEVTIIVNEDSLVEYTQASTANESIRILSGGSLTLAAGITLTLNGVGDFAPNSFNISATSTLVLCGSAECENDAFTGLGNLVAGGSLRADSYQIFACTGTLTYTSSTNPNLSWFSDLSSAITAIGAFETDLIIDTDDVMTGNVVVPITLSLKGTKGNTITTTGWTLTVNGPFEAGLYKVFDGSGNISFGNGVCKEVYPQWWDAVPNSFGDATANTAAFNAAFVAYNIVTVTKGIWWTNGTITINDRQGPILQGVSKHDSIIRFAPTANDICIDFSRIGGSLAVPLFNAYIRNLTINTNDTTYTKTAIKWEDVHGGGIHDVNIDSWHDVGTTSIGIHFYGREEFYVRDTRIDANQPMKVSLNPVIGGVAGLEYVNFRNLLLAGAADRSLIHIDDDLSIASFVMDGYNVFAGGLNGFYAPNIYLQATSLSLENITWDRPGANGGWFIYLDMNSAGTNKMLSLRNLVGYTGGYNSWNGFYVDNFDFANSTFENLHFYGSLGTEWGGSLERIYKYGFKSGCAFLALNAGAVAAWTLIDLSATISTNAKTVEGYVTLGAGTSTYLSSTIDASRNFLLLEGGSISIPFTLPLLTSQSLWYNCASGSLTVVITGYGY